MRIFSAQGEGELSTLVGGLASVRSTEHGESKTAEGGRRTEETWQNGKEQPEPREVKKNANAAKDK